MLQGKCIKIITPCIKVGETLLYVSKTTFQNVIHPPVRPKYQIKILPKCGRSSRTAVWTSAQGVWLLRGQKKLCVRMCVFGVNRINHCIVWMKDENKQRKSSYWLMQCPEKRSLSDLSVCMSDEGVRLCTLCAHKSCCKFKGGFAGALSFILSLVNSFSFPVCPVLDIFESSALPFSFFIHFLSPHHCASDLSSSPAFSQRSTFICLHLSYSFALPSDCPHANVFVARK